MDVIGPDEERLSENQSLKSWHNYAISWPDGTEFVRRPMNL